MNTKTLEECMNIAKENNHKDVYDMLSDHKDLVSYCESGDIDEVKNILDTKDISTTFCSGVPLNKAVEYNHCEVVKLLLEYGANPNGPN